MKITLKATISKETKYEKEYVFNDSLEIIKAKFKNWLEQLQAESGANSYIISAQIVLDNVVDIYG